MANQPEQPVYDPGVYQWEVTDPVQGGIGGVANAPVVNLANRTAYLKQRLDALTNGSIIPPTVAPLNGPAFTGSATAPNVAPGDDSTLISNTDFVQTAIHGLVVVPVGGNTNVTLTQPQWGVGILVFTGVLTANIAVIFPSRTGAWIVQDATTGSFTLTCRTAAGSGVSIVQSAPFDSIWCDGANIYPQVSPFALNLTNPVVIAALGYTPVQQGGGTNQLPNKVYIGYGSAGRLRAQVDATDFGNFAMENFGNIFTQPQNFQAGVNGDLNVNGTGNMQAGGNITALTRLRAALGARNSQDANAAPILSDFTVVTDSENQFSSLFPNNFSIQMVGAIVPVTAGTITTIVSLRQPFPNNIIGAMVCFLGTSPPQQVTLSAQPQDPSHVAVTTTSPIVGGGSVGVAILAFGV